MNVTIITDGSCNVGARIGGWGVVLKAQVNGHEHTKRLSGAAKDTTNNQMEMRAVLEGIKALTKRGCSITILTDSQLVHGYFQLNWRCKDKDLFSLREAIYAAVEEGQHTLTVQKVSRDDVAAADDLAQSARLIMEQAIA